MIRKRRQAAEPAPEPWHPTSDELDGDEPDEYADEMDGETDERGHL